MNITRRNLLMGGAAITFALAAAGSAAADGVTLSMASNGYPDMYHEIAQQFESRNPGISIEERNNPGSASYGPLVQEVLRDAITGNQPDVVFMGFNFIRPLVERKLAADLDPFIGAEPHWDQMGYEPSALDSARLGGKVYGLPYAVSMPVFIINDELVKQAGGDPAHMPSSWEDLFALADKVHALGEGRIGAHIEYEGGWLYQALVTSFGGSMMTPDERQIAFDQPPGLKALDTLKDFADAGMLDMTRDQARQLFSAGKIGLYLTSSANIVPFEKQAGDRFHVSVIPMPVAAPNGRVPGGGNAAVMLARDAAKQKAAWELIKFATGPVGQTIMAKYTGYMPSNTLATKDPALLGSYYDTRPNLAVAFKLRPLMTNWYAFPGENALKIVDVMDQDERAVIGGAKTPQQAMAAMVNDVTPLLPH